MTERCEYCGTEGRYGHTAVCVMNEVIELRAANERLRAALRDIEFIVDGKEDADDGIPNDAMKIMAVVQTALSAAGERGGA